MEFIFTFLSESIPYLIALIAVIVFLEQSSYLRRRSILPGPTLVIPFLGNAISLVKNPTKFWDDQSALAQSTPLGVSVNYIFGTFIVYIHSTELSHKVFANIRADAFQLVGHPFGKKLWGEHNLVYLFGQEHKDIRRRVAPSFTPKGIEYFNTIQQRILLKHLNSWLLGSNKASIPLRFLCRDMNLETSQTVLLGSYLSEEERWVFNTGYKTFNEGSMNLPVDLPGFSFRQARLSVQKLVAMLTVCFSKSEIRMKNSEEPNCVMDFWMLENLKEKAEAEQKGEKFEYRNHEIAAHLFDFLFAAQDASTSSLLWAVTLLDSHQEVLKRVRSEVEKYWNPNFDEPISPENLREMKFTEAVAKEVVRIRAPATMVPHLAQEDFPLTENYVIPKGTIVFPSVFDACNQGFPEPEKFDPDRFMEERQEDKVYKRNFLAFGAGPHQCAGQRYAINHLKLFIAFFSTLMEFKRDRVDDCDEFAYSPTIVPKDDCRVFLSRRIAPSRPAMDQ